MPSNGPEVLRFYRVARRYLDKVGEWRWRLTSRNGRILVASSEGFRTNDGARRNAAKVMRAMKRCVEAKD